MDDLRTLANLTFWPLAVPALLLPIAAGRRLAGFGAPNLWGAIAFLEWMTALNLIIQSTGETPVSRGVTLLCAAAWSWTGYWSYRQWKRDDDGKPPRKRVRAWIKARLPQARQTVPVKG